MNAKAPLPAPEFGESLEWFNTEQAVSLQQLRGRVVLLSFWTGCCINSMHVLQDLQKLEKKFQGKLSVIGIHSPKFQNEHISSQLQKTINRLHIRHPVANDPKFEMWRAYGIKAWPTIIFIAPEGHVIGVLRGEGRWDQLETLIEKHVALETEKGVIAGQNISIKLKPEPKSTLSFPSSVCATRNHLYISDSGRNRILETWHDGRVRRIFGSGSPGMLDGQEQSASFNNPQGIVEVGEFLYIADAGNHAIRRLHIRSGEVMTLAGNGEQGRFVADKFQDPAKAQLNAPWDITYHESNLYIAMAGQHQIWRMNLNHLTIERFAGTGRQELVDGAIEEANFAKPSGIGILNGRLYIADAESSSIRIIDLNRKQVDTLVGKGLFDFGDREGTGIEARLQHPLGLEVDQQRNALWIADTYNSKIKRVDLKTRQVSKFKINFPLDEPGGLSLFNDKLFIANTNAHQIVCLDLSSRLTEVIDVQECDNSF